MSVGKIQALLVFCLGFACRQKPNVLECAVAKKLKNKKCGWAKNKTSLRWLAVRAVSPFVCLCVNFRVISFRLMVCTVVIGFPLTFSGLAKVAILHTNFNTKHQRSNLAKTVIRSTAPPLLQPVLPAYPLFRSFQCLPCFGDLSVVLGVVSGVYFFEGKEKNFKIHSVGKGGSSFASFGLRVGLCGLQMCLHLYVSC